MKKITVNKTRILTAAAALVAVFSLAGCGSTAVKEVPQPAETSRSEEATLETAAPEATATPAPTPDVVVPTSVTLEQEGGILNNGMTWTLHATVLPEDAADKTITWTSADESVATIDDSGVITTHAPGQTTITAASTAGGVSTTYNLVVQEVVKCSYCGGTGHTADTCAVKKTAEQQTAAVAAQQQAAAQAAEQAAAAQAAAPAGPVTGWLVVLDGPARGRDLRLGIGRSFLGLDDAGAPITLSADAPLSARQAVVVYDAEKNSFVLLPGSSQELCYLGEEAVLAPSPLTGGETLRLGGAALTFVPLCGGAFHW